MVHDEHVKRVLVSVACSLWSAERILIVAESVKVVNVVLARSSLGDKGKFMMQKQDSQRRLVKLKAEMRRRGQVVRLVTALGSMPPSLETAAAFFHLLPPGRKVMVTRRKQTAAAVEIATR